MVVNKTGFIFSFLLAIITFISFPSYDKSRAEGLLEEGDYSFDASIGYHYADVNGYRGKVGEYEVLDPGMEGHFTFGASLPGKYFDLWGEIKDKNDQRYMMGLDVNRLFQSETSYNRFKHYLDHDPLTNQDFYTDFDAGETNAIIWEEIKSENVIRIPFIPNFKLKADFRQLNKRGQRQVTTVSKCDQCHVTSSNKRINQTTEDVKLGAEMTLGPLTIDYKHLQRNFNEGGSFPIAYYGFGARSFPVKGFGRYGTVPDSRTYVNQFKAKANLPLQSALYFDYEMGEHRNRETRRKREFESFAFRFTTAGLKYIKFNFNHYDYDMDSNVRGAMDKDVRRSGVSFTTRPWKRNFLRGSYRWEDIDRTNSAEESTLKKVFTLSLFSRPHRRLDLNIRYRNERIDDPFLLEQWELFGLIQQTSLPNSRESVRVSLNWNPRGNISLSSTFTYEDADSDRYNIDEERMEMMFSIWFAPIDKLMITGSYSVIETEMETRSIYKTYHRGGPLDYLFDNSTNYNDKSQSYNLTVNYRFTRNIALVSNLTFNDSHADFDSSVYDSNIGELSDLNIENVDASIGLDYLYKPNISFYTRYNYRDYNDREVNDLDGEVHLMSIGASYTF
jgi:hypothetical protein